MSEGSPDSHAETSFATPASASINEPEEPPLRRLLRVVRRGLGLNRNGEDSVRVALDELIEGRDAGDNTLRDDERMLLLNILQLRDRSVVDVMVPRADVVAIDSEAKLPEVIDLITKTGHSRLPVYRETLDDAIGMIHIKDVLAWRGRDDEFQLGKILRRVLFVAPSMEILQLLLEMRAKRSHMALVVDEFGGVDGLLTIEDVVEEIVGEIADEHEKQTPPVVVTRPDGSIDADARADVEILDEHFGALISEDEREEVDTLGGLVVALAGRVPIRGELVSHPAGIEFEVLEADPRRVRRLRVRSPGTTGEETPPLAKTASSIRP